MSNLMIEMAKAKARYSNNPDDQLVPLGMFDPHSFKKPDGSLDTDAMAHSMYMWAQAQFKKIEADKKEAAEGKADG